MGAQALSQASGQRAQSQAEGQKARSWVWPGQRVLSASSWAKMRKRGLNGAWVQVGLKERGLGEHAELGLVSRKAERVHNVLGWKETTFLMLHQVDQTY